LIIVVRIKDSGGGFQPHPGTFITEVLNIPCPFWPLCAPPHRGLL